MRALVIIDLRQEPEQAVHAAVAWAEEQGVGRLDLAHVEAFVDRHDPLAEPRGALSPWEGRTLPYATELGRVLRRIPPLLRGQTHLLFGDLGSTLAPLAPAYDVILVGRRGVWDDVERAIPALTARTLRPVILLEPPAPHPHRSSGPPSVEMR